MLLASSTRCISALLQLSKIIFKSRLNSSASAHWSPPVCWPIPRPILIRSPIHAMVASKSGYHAPVPVQFPVTKLHLDGFHARHRRPPVPGNEEIMKPVDVDAEHLRV